jgi:hypothetical protein
MSKSPFEVRLELLQMSKDFLEKQYEAHLKFAQEAYAKAMEQNIDVAKEWEKFLPKQFSVDEIMAKAAEMYSFVSKRD